MTNTANWPRYLLLVESLVLAALIQLTLFLSSDVQYLTHVADMLLSGGKYGIDFYETNPPMILYLYMPPLLLHKLTSIGLVTCLRFYVFVIAALSVMASFYYLKKLVHDTFLQTISFSLLLFISLFLPANQFGQREHLYILLFTPYVFASACALSHIKLKNGISILTGLAAALGCCMKPYFLLPLILIELYFVYRQKGLFGWIRLETITILSVMILYLATTYYFYPTYFSIILPLVSQFYFEGIAQEWTLIFIFPHVLFCVGVSAASIMTIRYSRYPELITVLVLTCIGTTLAFLVTRTMWFYHTLPALAYTSLLISFIIAELAEPVNLRSSMLFISAFLLALYVPLLVFNEYTFGPEFQYEKQCKQDLINTLAAQPGKHSVICFSANTMTDCYPLINALGSQHQSRYPFFWWMRGAITLSEQHQANDQIQRFMNQTAEDLIAHQTRWIVINTTMTRLVMGKDFNYFNYFSSNDKMKKVLASYHFWKSVDNYDVYERTSS